MARERENKKNQEISKKIKDLSKEIAAAEKTIEIFKHNKDELMQSINATSRQTTQKRRAIEELEKEIEQVQLSKRKVM